MDNPFKIPPWINKLYLIYSKQKYKGIAFVGNTMVGKTYISKKIMEYIKNRNKYKNITLTNTLYILIYLTYSIYSCEINNATLTGLNTQYIDIKNFESIIALDKLNKYAKIRITNFAKVLYYILNNIDNDVLKIGNLNKHELEGSLIKKIVEIIKDNDFVIVDNVSNLEELITYQKYNLLTVFINSDEDIVNARLLASKNNVSYNYLFFGIKNKEIESLKDKCKLVFINNTLDDSEYIINEIIKELSI